MARSSVDTGYPKDAVGGFYVVDCESREDALELAGRVLVSPRVAVEVLPLVGA